MKNGWKWDESFPSQKLVSDDFPLTLLPGRGGFWSTVRRCGAPRRAASSTARRHHRTVCHGAQTCHKMEYPGNRLTYRAEIRNGDAGWIATCTDVLWPLSSQRLRSYFPQRPVFSNQTWVFSVTKRNNPETDHCIDWEFGEEVSGRWSRVGTKLGYCRPRVSGVIAWRCQFIRALVLTVTKWIISSTGRPIGLKFGKRMRRGRSLT